LSASINIGARERACSQKSEKSPQENKMASKEVKIQPLGSRVLVRPDNEAESRTSSGLYIPETAKEKPQTGEIIAIGDDDEEIKVKVGQKILYPKYTGTEIKLDGVDHIIMDADDILAIVKD
jgi:chaperonin GroES